MINSPSKMTDLNDAMSSPYFRVKLIALVHFVFLSNAMLGTWSHSGFLFYNILFMVSLFWTLHCKESKEAIETALVIDACSIILDLISLVVFFHYMNGWAVVFTIINMIIRPLTVMLLYREYTNRGGAAIPTSSVFPTSQQRSYQDIDRTTQPVPSNNTQPGQNVAVIF
ncbi:type-1 angiotensin II receptor-associated protein [Eupeodes corollae]|uniref:type-1 angiotensin II receptor-associated protein n=1 Tax=Eupeodes corollae TaxID=290404 RepID=UPI002492B73A|nr:type-1 angiotensin II receptor-associated protein [Eupeodes corollae]